MELHSLDRHVPDRIELPSDVYSLNTAVEIDKLKDILKELPSMFKLSAPSLYVLSLLINDIGTHNNIDNINNVKVDDLLIQLYKLKKMYPESIDDIILDIQLDEMRTGMCPQGRSIRLLQVLLCATYLRD